MIALFIFTCFWCTPHFHSKPISVFALPTKLARI